MEIFVKRFLIVGCARNVEKVISGEIATLFRAFSPFGEVSFYIVESDSGDSTVSALQALTDKYDDFQFVSLGKVSDRIPDRYERMAYCRNQYVSFIRNLSTTDIPEYVVVADLDGVNCELSRESVDSCFSRSDWDAVFANQGKNYYDVFALRVDNWCPNDPWQEFWRLRDLGVPEMRAKEIAIHNKQSILRKDSPWIPVKSAFGGLAIYKSECFTNAEYSVIDSETGVNTCEHVSFNHLLMESDKKLLINPRLINSTWNDHNKIHKIRSKTRRKMALVRERFSSRKVFNQKDNRGDESSHR
jgi:hypothetical protein